MRIIDRWQSDSPSNSSKSEESHSKEADFSHRDYDDYEIRVWVLRTLYRVSQVNSVRSIIGWKSG